MTKQNEPIVGYGGFDTFEECYEYNEIACFIADTELSRWHSIRSESRFTT